MSVAAFLLLSPQKAERLELKEDVKPGNIRTSAIIWGIAIVLVQVYYYEGYIATVNNLSCRIGLLGDH